MAPVITRLLSIGLFRAPGFRRIAANASARKWFYEKARKPTRDSIARWLPDGVPVTVIGDARVAGKTDAAVRDALFSAYGLASS